MSAQTSPAEKGLNPGLLCQESYTCSGTDEAVFECDECCSLQCLRCEEELHRQERLRNHERIRLKAGHVPYCDPCKGPSGHSPGVKQRAVVRCQTCKISLCLECQKRTHSGGNKRRHPITVYHVTKVQELLEEEGIPLLPTNTYMVPSSLGSPGEASSAHLSSKNVKRVSAPPLEIQAHRGGTGFLFLIC